MKLATWNVNSLKVRLPHVLEWLEANQPDALCLQETKLIDANFPLEEIKAAGYEAIFSGQKTYNGVAILSRSAARDRVDGIPGFDDEQKRVLAATIDDVRVICIYVPNGESLASEKFPYKLKWLDALQGWLKTELENHPKIAVLGDYNIAPEDRDVHDPKAWEGGVLVSSQERALFREILSLGFRDSFRLFDQSEKAFTWWDYRMNAFRRNMGLRIDHVLLSEALADKCSNCKIDSLPRKLERPSDHAPVVAEVGV
ncbi:MAG: exodeoxyribonuclease III [Burkholderiales bacterium]|nr:exodeoxyribonuclease III [Burkholderiales bacterium]